MHHITRKSQAILAFVCLVLFLVSPANGSLDSRSNEQQWVLQLGYFANLENAQNFQDTLIRAGYDVLVLSTGKPDDQRYQVISEPENEAADLESLRSAIKMSLAVEGFAVIDPRVNSHATAVANDAASAFRPLKAKYLVAQAGPSNVADASPMRTSSYTPMFERTPQEEIDSMPGFTMAGMPIVPTIGLSLGYDDNVTAASQHEISSWFYQISPAIRLEIPSDRSFLSLTAAAEIVRYQDSPVDDRDTWYLRGDYAWDISTRQDLSLFAEYRVGVDHRGVGRRQGDAGLMPLEPDEWESFGYGGEWDYGALGARGRLTLKAGASDLEYANNRGDIVSGELGTRAFDRDWHYYGGTFYWRVAPKTSVLVDYLFTDMNYETANEFDSEIESWMLGITWDATARTSGTIQYGNQKRNFADPGHEDYDGPTWVATVNWRPRTYSMFTLTGTRNTQEPNGHGDFVLRQDITLSWVHNWATRFGTVVDVGYGEDDYRPDGRSDELFYWGVGAHYTFNQHFRFGAGINGYDRSSEVLEFDYQRTVYLLTLEASF